MQRIFIILIVFFTWTVAAGLGANENRAVADEPEVIVETDRTRLYEGESLLYRVTLNHVENPVEPDLKPLENDFDVKSLGSQSLNSHSVTIINGQRSETTRYGRQYNYRLTPLRIGEFTIPAPSVQVDGRDLHGRDVSITVLAPDEQDVVRMEITTDRESVYPMQPFWVTLSVAIKALPTPHQDVNSVSVQRRNPPVLTIPWAVDEQLPDGLRPKIEWQRWLGETRNSRGIGFNVNNLRDNSLMAMMSGAVTFMPMPEKVKLADKSGKETDYWRFEFKREFTAERIGDFTFGPATLKGSFAVGVEAGRPIGEDIYAVAKPVSVVVKDVPIEGRPDCYVGAIGKFDFTASLTPKKVKTGDPMTLTLTMTGEGAWDAVSPPAIGKTAAIADHFKIYDATEQSKGNRREFTYSLRPLDAGITEFPAVPVAYFDVDSDKYVTIETDPIAIDVTKAVKLSGSDIVGPIGTNGNHRQLEMSREGIFANITDPSMAVDQSVRPERWLIALAGLVVFYVMIGMIVSRRRRVGGDVALRRRRSASSDARRRLDQAVEELAAGRACEGADLVGGALLWLVADMLDLPAAGLTSTEACRRLESQGVEVELIGRLRSLLETCEGVRYGASGGASMELAADAKSLLKPLAAALKKA